MSLPLNDKAVPASAGTVTVEVNTLGGIVLAEGTLVEQLSAGVVLSDARWIETGESIQNDDTGDTVFLCGRVVPMVFQGFGRNGRESAVSI